MKAVIAMLAILTSMSSGVLASPAEMGERICCGSFGCHVLNEDDYLGSLKASDDELNETYKAVLLKYDHLPEAITAIRQAQRTWIRLRDQDFEAARLSWARQADIDSPDIENSRLFAGIRQKWNLSRAAYLCETYLQPRG